MPGFNGPEINKIREYMFEPGDGVRVVFGGMLGPLIIAPDIWFSPSGCAEITDKEANYASRILQLIKDSNA
jgi:hypothetical protein